MSIDLLHFTTTIVSSYVTRHELHHTDDLQTLIRDTYKTLGEVAHSAKDAAPEIPAVPLKASVFPDHIVCLCCGKEATMLKRHIMNAHALTIDQYKAKWGLPSDYPMLAPNYSERRSEIAKEQGLGRTR